ncbi:MAG: hypothetical protein GC190_18675 [Alphaproteobacteria bacterium]|nr:hypothetical protein [Alphaproteobacteria bacterium]
MNGYNNDAGRGSIAVTVVRAGAEFLPCPFYGRCDGLLVMDAQGGVVSFASNAPHNVGYLSSLILQTGVKRLICGFIPDDELLRLRAAGVDVRLCSCACGVDELIVDFAQLPSA